MRSGTAPGRGLNELETRATLEVLTSTPISEPFSAHVGAIFPSRATRWVLAAGAAAIAIYFVLPGHAQSVWYVLIGLMPIAAIYTGAIRRVVAARLAWHFFAAGLLTAVVGDAISGVYEVHLGHEPPVPSVADGFYLATYPFFAVGIVLLLRELGGHSTRVALLDTLILSAAVALVQWVFFVSGYVHEHLHAGARIVDMAYPWGDLLLLVGVSQLLVGPGRRTLSYRLIVLALALWGVGDEIFGLDQSSYAAGGWLDVFWLGSYVAWAAAASDPSVTRIVVHDRRSVPRLTRERMLLLGGALLTPPVVLLIEQLRGHDPHAYLVAGVGAGIASLVLARLAALVRSYERARTEERTARREAERAQRLLAAQNEQLRELDRLKDEFVASVSHELRTPLTSISGYVELLRELEDNREAAGYLEIVDRNADRLLSLVDDVLFAARIQSRGLQLRVEPVDLQAVVRASVDAARPRADRANVKLRALGAGPVPAVRGEAGRLAQVLDNLLSNAIKFSPEQGAVDVILEVRDGTVVLEVVDNGMGIAETELDRLFQRFFRTQSALDRHIPGTGLGLYISKAIVEAHGGRIGVRSAEGKGTSFVVELPAAT